MALLQSSQILLTLVFLAPGISLVHSTEFQCQADLSKPVTYGETKIVTYGETIIVTCTTSKDTIISLKITRPGSPTPTDLIRKHSKQRLEKVSGSSHTWKFKIYDTNFTDSGVWKIVGQVQMLDSGVENQETELTIKIVKHPTKVQVNSLEPFEQSVDNTKIVDLGDKDQETKTLSCIAEGTKPEPTFEWKINRELIEANTIKKVSDETFESHIDVKIDKFDYKKVVTCQVYQVQSQSKNDSITIEAYFNPSKVSLMNSSVQVIDLMEGQDKESKVLTCVAENVNPQPTFEWTINGKDFDGQLGSIEKFGAMSYKNSITIDLDR